MAKSAPSIMKCENMFCAGCGHSLFDRLLGEVLTEMDIIGESISCSDIGCNHMYQYSMAVDTVIGVNRDKLFGPMVLFGLGGVNTELLRDVALYPAPFGKAEALRMIGSLKLAKLFGGYRGGAALDVDALAELLSDVSRFAYAQRDSLAELDLNPVFVYEKGKGVAIADALIVLEE